MRSGYDIFLIKRVVDDNMGILDFPKKTNWRLQTEAIIHAFGD